MIASTAQAWLDAIWACSGIPPRALRSKARMSILGFWRQLAIVGMLDAGIDRGIVAATFERDRTSTYYMEQKARGLLRQSREYQWGLEDLKGAVAARVAARIPRCGQRKT